ncbi:type II toxin-antitoxin system VapC family toxin [Sphingomonas sp. HITSZ_GF]|uniref:type II toxin-antitoxin system VapC family toxin n=1 Tax=Sphingomonas sp. HITSZ_GF TaxID=3037247 RepID=UPI00240D2992|nr:type II toxin-antitoxin system VapC family toxin [Sphingomonas sp. HITSZ_GF]MDG2533824.1 type II toxin-antitoxin system VapC family toxin [Sphingomonas sp. HITSZ_GF]
MIVDTSAIMAILLGEAEARSFVEAIVDAERCVISGGSWIELSAVLVRRNHQLDDQLALLMERGSIEIEPVTEVQARIGHAAYKRYGIGSGHAARLNFGDCFAYALAKATAEPLLYKGDDFAKTDIIAA